MNQTINVKISALQAACMELISYMTTADEIFQKIVSSEPEYSKRWEIFQREKTSLREVTLSQMREMASKLKDTQMIEAEVLIR